MAKKIIIPKMAEKAEKKCEVLNLVSQPPAETYVEILKKRSPHKLNYSITETAGVINLSYDFIRERIISGSIAAVKYGKNYMINRYEVARLLAEGVE